MRRILILIAAIAVAATPVVATAAPAWFPIVPCGVQGSPGNPTPCSPCHLFQGVKNVTDLVLFGITGPIAAFMVTLAGGMMLLGGASPSQYSRGKEILTNTLSGVTVILLAWVATNFLIKSVGNGSTADTWYQFTCPAFLSSIVNEETLPVGYGAVPPVPRPPARPFATLPNGVSDSTYAALALWYKTKNPKGNSPALERLISCIYSDPVIAALTGPRPANGGKQTGNNFTYDNDYEACNYTRGFAILGGRCSHAQYSCHYGGRNGTNGAEAVDLNALGGSVEVAGGRTDPNGKPIKIVANEQRLYCELYRLLQSKKCPDFKYLDLHDEHNHVSTTSCDADGTGLGKTTSAEACKSILAMPEGSSEGQ